jgi:spore coat polysaccharide biosynthesis protein SpsF
MADLTGVPVLGRVIERTVAVPSLQGTVVATTLSAMDDPIEDYCRQLGIKCFRGSEQDVLDRYMKCAVMVGARAVVRITSDCPLLEPGLLDFMTTTFLQRKGDVEYLCNILPPSFPDGLDLEIFSREALERVWKEARDPVEREHVTLHFWKNADNFRLMNVLNHVDMSRFRWTLDTGEDLNAIREIYESNCTVERPIFGMEEIIEWLEEREEKNSAVTGKKRRHNSLTVKELEGFIQGKDIQTVIYQYGKNRKGKYEGCGSCN